MFVYLKKKLESNEESNHNVIMAKDLRLLFMGFYSSGPHCLEFLLKFLNCYPYKQSTKQSRKKHL